MSNTFCPIPWIFQAVRNNGDVRVCCQANVTKNRGVVRKPDGSSYNAGRDNMVEARNTDMMKDVKCPMFILHGKKDNLIPVSHSEELFDNLGQSPAYLHLPDSMDHNEFQIDEDLINPIKAFLRKLDERDLLKAQISGLEQNELFLLKNFGDYSDPKKQQMDILNPFQDKKEKEKCNYSFKIKNFEISKKELTELQNHKSSITKKFSIKNLHYDIKTSTYNMQTNISKVDESFVDYLQENNKTEDNYGQIISSLAGVTIPKISQEQEKKEISESKEDLKTNFMVYFDISLFEPPPIVLKLEEKLLKSESAQNEEDDKK